jgi:[protein-PII] uridylyltransferase
LSLSDLLYRIDSLTSIDDTVGFKACVADSYRWLEQQFSIMQVDELVHGRATFVDALLCQAWQLLELDQQKNLSLVAVGGYGRGQLQPHSDVDLLILSAKPLGKEQQETISRFITLLWDIKLDVGQSVRTVKETITLAKEDITIATNLVEARLLIGSAAPYDSLQKQVKARGFWKSQDFFLAKHKEQQIRHAKFHDTSYNLEPNVKENPGCLRDIQTIGWVAKKHFKVWNGKELVEHGYFTAGEWRELIECRSHLWRKPPTFRLPNRCC